MQKKLEKYEKLGKYERRRDIEKFAIDNLSEKLKDVISKEELICRINNNGFNGLYILNDEDYGEVLDEMSNVEQTKEGKLSLGFYNLENKVIILKDSALRFDSSIVEHELMHAYFGENLRATIKYNSSFMSYGYGYEEAIASLIQSGIDLNNLEDINTECYYYQVRVFKQLDILYRTVGNNKYINLLYLAVKEPESFMKSIVNIYIDILERVKEKSSLNTEDILALSYKTALNITTCIDDLCFSFNEQHGLTEQLNSLYFSLMLGFNYNNKYDDKFLGLENFTSKIPEENLMLAIFGTCEFNVNDRISKINDLLTYGTYLNDGISSYQKEKSM